MNSNHAHRRPTGEQIKRWYPEKWEDFTGLTILKTFFLLFVQSPGLFGNVAVTGPYRTGKTRLISHAIKAKRCPERTAEFDPCHKCGTCRSFGPGRFSDEGLFALITGCNLAYVAIDCYNVTPTRLRDVAMGNEFDVPMIVHADEARELGKRQMEGILLKALDEKPQCMWVLSAPTLGKQTDSQGKLRKVPALSQAVRRRITHHLHTTLPGDEELIQWLRTRCEAWEISHDGDQTLAAVAKSCRWRPGFALHVLAAAADLGRNLTQDFVKDYALDSI